MIYSPLANLLSSRSILRSCFHTSSQLLGGRYTTQEPDRVKHWRQHLSKKAKKRISRSTSLSSKREGAAAGNVLASIRRQELNRRSMLGPSTTISSSSSLIDGTEMALSNPNNMSLSTLNAATSSAVIAKRRRERTNNQELSPLQIANLSRKNQVVIETVLMSESPPVTEMEALKMVDIDALGKTLRSKSLSEFDKRSWIDLIRACGAQGRFSLAVNAFSEMREIAAAAASSSETKGYSSDINNNNDDDDVYAYTALLHSCGLQRNIDAAKEVYKSMVQDGLSPTHVTVGALIQAHVRAFDLKGASAVLQAALKDGVTPTPLLFTPIIVGHIQNGEHEEAWEVYHSMRELYCEPDVVTYTAMISSCAKRDMVEKAVNLFDELRKNGHQATHVTYSTMLHASARSMRLYHHAFSIFHEMGSLAGLSYDLRSFNAVLLACSQQGDVVKAREYMADMIRKNVKPDSVTAATLLTVYARALKNVRLMGVPRGAAAAAISATGMRGVNAIVPKPPSSSSSSTSSGDTSPVDDFNSRNASGLSLLDKEGLLNPSTRLIQKRVLERLPQARLIEGSTNDVVEGLLRDYYVGPRATGGDGSVEEESLLESLSHRGVDRDKSLQERYLPPLKDISLNLGSDEYKSFRDALLASGVVDKDLIDDIEEEHSRMPSLNPSVEAARAEKFEKRHIERMKKLEEEALALAKSEVMGIQENSLLTSKESSSLSPPTSSSPSLSSSSSKMLLDSIQRGEKLSMEDYLVELEKEVMTGLYGPPQQFNDEESNVSDNTMNSNEKSGENHHQKKKWEWESIFSSPDSIIGGVPLKDLLDESTVKLPPPTKEDIALGGTGSIEDALRNPIEVDKFVRSAIEKRVREALDREAATTTATTTALMGMKTTTTMRLNSQTISTVVDSTVQTPVVLNDSTTSSSFTTSLSENPKSPSSSPPPLPLVLEDEPSPTKKKRGFAARVLSRLLEPSSAGRLESLLVRATDDDDVAQSRRSSSSSSSSSSSQPGLADILLSVQKLKARVNNGSLFNRPKTATTALSKDDDKELSSQLTTTIAATPLQDEAVLGVARWINKRGNAGSVRLRGLINLSDETFGAGAHWLTSLEAYPSDTALRKKALVEEVNALVFQEFPKMGVVADLPLLNAALSCLCNAGESKAAYDLISTHFPKLSIAPDARTFRPLIRMHVNKGETSRAEASLSAMQELGLSPDAECFGLVVHAQAKDWRVKDAIETVREMKEKYNIELPEFYASLLRRRCKEMGIVHPLVPEHPIGWMYSERIMQKKKSDSVETRKQVRQGVRHVLKSGMR